MRLTTCLSGLPLFLLVFGCAGGVDGDPESPAGGAPGGGSPAGGAGQGGLASGGSSTTTTGGTGGASTAGTGGASTAGTGGSAGTGTAGGGNGGGPAHIVADCDGLGAVNEWEQITPPGVTSVLSIVADPINAGTVYAGTDKAGVHKSTNCGADWTKVNTGMGADKIDSGMQWTMAIDPINPSVLFAGSLYGNDLSLLRSTNSGLDWASLFPAGSEVANTVDYTFFQEVSMDPLDHLHLVVSFHADCKGEYAPTCMAESTDGGDNWRLFKGPTNGWGENARPMVINSTTFLFVTWADGVFYTDDNGASWEKLANIPGGNHQMILIDGTYYMGSHAGVFESADGYAWTKIEGSPGGADGLATDGERFFTGKRDAGDMQPYFSAPSSAAPWTSLSSPSMAHGPVYLAYEGDHHLLYSSNTDTGAWRMVTK